MRIRQDRHVRPSTALCRTCQAGAAPSSLLPSRAELHRAWHLLWTRWKDCQ